MRKVLVILLLSSLAFAQDLKRPTVDATASALTFGCDRGNTTSTAAMPNSYDAAGLLTSSINSAAALYKSSKSSARVFTTWQSPGGSYSALTLNINALSPGWLSVSTGGGNGEACISYSLTGGASWNSVICDDGVTGVGWPQQTFSITLNPAQDLSKVQVGVCTYGYALGNPGDSGGDGVLLYDIWTLGTSASAPVGNGSSSGSPHRGVVIAN